MTRSEEIFLCVGTRVALRRLSAQDREVFVDLVNVSSDLLFPWVYLPGTPEKFDEYIKRFDGENAECTLVCERESGSIVGTISISQIMRGPYQRGTVGYNAFMPWAGRGYMSEGLSLASGFAFNDLGLHRLEADIQPDNKLSLRLAENVGFRREGYSPAFILINGAWKDHERWAINREDLQ
jgi:[ribosomal protein S5]-alanine N-acetyltransferase